MSKTALVIGDDDAIGDFVALILRRIHIDVLRASNGHRGIKMTLAHLPDLILSGHHMPYCTGLDVLKTIRAHSRTCHIPFISMFSSYGATTRRQHLLYGADDAIAPPFGTVGLLNAVCNVLKKSDGRPRVHA